MELKPGYKLTEIGVIPVEWEVKNLGAIGKCIIGLTYTPEDVRHDGLLVLRSSNIGEGKLVFDDNVFVDVPLPDRLVARRNDILICVRNGSRDLIGKCALIDERAEGMTFGAFMSVFRSEYTPYVFHQFQSDLIKRQIHENIGATINQITNANLNSFLIPFPPLAEQQAIAAALSDVDALIDALDRQIAKQRDLKQGAMQELLTGQRRLPGFDGAWEEHSFGEIFKFLRTANNARSDLSQFGEFAYVHYGEIHTKGDSFLDVSVDELPRIQQSKVAGVPSVETGDLIMADASEDYDGIGVSVEVMNVRSAKVVAGLHTLLLRGDPALVSNGFKGYLQFIPSVKADLIRLATGISVYGISKNSVRSIKVRLPPPDEQAAIAAVLSEMDAEIAALEAQRDKTRALKQGMMQELLTGRTRLL